MEWPLKEPQTGKPKTTPTNMSIWKAAIEPAAKEYPNDVQTWLNELESKKKKWRNEYVSILEGFSRIQLKTSPQTMVAMCQAGFDAAKDAFVFRSDGEDKTMSLDQAWEKAFVQSESSGLETKSLHGGRADGECDRRMRLGSPHGSLAEPLYVFGKDAAGQATKWAEYGCMEPSAAKHACSVFEKDDVTPYLTSHVFVILGVTSEMGPATHLLRIPGAHVVGIARKGPKLQRLMDFVQNECPASSSLQVTEADMLKEGPRIARWLVDLLKAHTRKVVLMPMAYMDGEANCRVVLSMEQIITYVKKNIPGCATAYYPTPTTCYMIPPECAMDAKERYEASSSERLIPSILQFTSLGFWCKPVKTWEQLEGDNPRVLLNGLVHLQGPSYALAKQMQLWRCVLAAAANETVIPIVAPGTRTESVVHSPEAAAALEGIQAVAPPNVCFDIATSSTLLAAILLSKLQEPAKRTDCPLELFWDGAVHGGIWRCPYDSRSYGIASYLYGKTLAKAGSCPSGALAPLSTHAEEA